MELFDHSIAVPLFVSNFVTLLLIVFFGRDRNRQKMAYKSQIAQLEAKSLEAQMNPHFIYNTLNGIQSVMVLKGEQVANEYIGLFAQMLRKTLDFSLAENLSLQEEIEYIEAYIRLQNIRRNDPVKFEVSCAENVDLLGHTLVPMLLQPIVENCMLHAFSSQLKKYHNQVAHHRKVKHFDVENRRQRLGTKKSLRKQAQEKEQYRTSVLRDTNFERTH